MPINLTSKIVMKGC